MSVTVNLSADEVAQIKRATEVEDEKEAVGKALREFLRVAGLRELKAVSGKVDYVEMAG
jgi:Arc/MetJ family transcription regulator